MYNQNSEGNNSGWIFLAGLATGAVVGYLLNTDRGRQMRADAAEKAVEYGNQAGTYAQEKLSTAKTAVNDAIEKGKSYASDVSNKIQNAISKTSDSMQETVEDAGDAFQRGANKAKARVNNMVEG